MTSRDRLLAAWNGQVADHVPLTTWCFGLPAPQHLRWERDGREITHWYSMRGEHLHTLPQPWNLEDDFRRALAWQSLGVDDVLDVSVPWSAGEEVGYTDSVIPAGQGDAYAILVREYETPDGRLRHAVRQTDPEPPGWPVQPGHVPLIEDFNIPRAIEHAVSGPGDVAAVRHLFQPPNDRARSEFVQRMKTVRVFAEAHGLPVQAWSAFGMDAVVWLAGAEGAVMMALDAPEAFGALVDAIAETDHARTELALYTPGVDMVVQRGWYSSTDFWSPTLFDRYVFPHLRELASLVHHCGRKLGYVMTTGVETLGPRLADAGVDVLYFVDPVQDGISPERARELFTDRMTVVGGTNALSLGCGDLQRCRDEVRRAVEVLGPTGRFVLHPVDALFPDTPWEGVEALIAAWKECVL